MDPRSNNNTTPQPRPANAKNLGRVINILHLTDLHFKCDADGTACAHRKVVTEDLLNRLDELLQYPDPKYGGQNQDNSSNWRPHFVAVSGDIAYTGSEKEYKEALEFFSDLRKKLGQSVEIIVCPGNHDRSPKYSAGLAYPKSADEADAWLTLEALQPDECSTVSQFSRSPLVVPFWNFQSFCRTANFLQPESRIGLEYLIGTKCTKIHGVVVEFLVLNTAWFCNHKEKADARNLWLGLPILQGLQISRNKQNPSFASTPAEETNEPSIRIALAHHPKEWLHEAECNSYSDRPNTYRILAENCDMILSGHVHGGIEPPSRAYEGAMVYTGGSTYSGVRWRNNFSILQIDLDERVVSRRAFEFDPRIMRWQEAPQGHGNHELHGHGMMPGETEEKIQGSDLEGEWSSVFWRESRKEARKFYNTVRFAVTDDGKVEGKVVDKNGLLSNESSEHHFTIDAKFKDGYLTGTWNSELRWGSLQVMCYRKGQDLHMRGRWVGFDRNQEVAIGQWRFRKPIPANT